MAVRTEYGSGWPTAQDMNILLSIRNKRLLNKDRVDITYGSFLITGKIEWRAK